MKIKNLIQGNALKKIKRIENNIFYHRGTKWVKA